jgi:hypothetical protein
VSYGNPGDDFLLATYNYVPMSYAEFSRSLEDNEPPSGLPPLLEALWWDAKGDWSRAHGIAQDIESADAAWVHAYLHRENGDEGNAGYWYGRAGKPHCETATEIEWRQIADHLLGP